MWKKEEEERERVAEAGKETETEGDRRSGKGNEGVRRRRRSRKKSHLTCAIFLYSGPSVFHPPTLAYISFIFSLISSLLFSLSLYHCPHPSLPSPAMACLWLQAASETWPRAFNH